MRVKGGGGSYKRGKGESSAQNMFTMVGSNPIEVLLILFIWVEGGRLVRTLLVLSPWLWLAVTKV